jgi:hypothetical protein
VQALAMLASGSASTPASPAANRYIFQGGIRGSLKREAGQPGRLRLCFAPDSRALPGGAAGCRMILSNATGLCS